MISELLTAMGQKLAIPDFHHQGTSSYQVVMIGLDNAGKTTCLYRSKLDQYVNAPPTIGFNCEKIRAVGGRSKGSTFTVWDVGGQEKMRPLWRSYLRSTDAIVFVVDSADPDTFEEAKVELTNIMRSSDVPSTVPILLLANKQDLPDAKTQTEIESALGLKDWGPTRPYEILSCCAVTGEGLDDLFDSLLDLIQRRRHLDKLKKEKAGR